MKKLLLAILGLIMVGVTYAQETVTDIDGNVYETVVIGNQTWMVENLKVTRFNNGDYLTQITDRRGFRDATREDTPTIWKYYDNDENLGEIYGKLYNWWAANDSRGLCPVGWRTPTEDDVMEGLLKQFDKRKAANALKEGTTDYWKTSSTDVNNSSGFNALPGGMCTRVPFLCMDMGDIGLWWIAKDFSRNVGWAFRLSHDLEHVSWDYLRKNILISVRCVKE